MSESKHLYKLSDIKHCYALGEHAVIALDGISLEIFPSQFVTIMGPSGSGKSTLLSILGLIERPSQGQLLWQGVNLKEQSEKQWNHLRRYQFGFIFQEFHLFPVLTAAENVEYFLARQGLERTERQQRVEEALTMVGLKDQINKRPGEMSGGQRQRVAIARALAKRPKVIIADEPTASLDQTTSGEILQILRDLTEKEQTTVIMASHDPLVLDYSKKLYHLKDGQLTDG
ncbi:MAG: ABC transporter ATP-binding protein [Oligoflexus sp.]